MATALASERRNLRLAVDNKWNAVKQLDTLEKRLRKVGDAHQADQVRAVRRQVERLPV